MARALLLLIVPLFASNAAAGGVPEAEKQVVRFAELVRRGDELRAAGSLSEALRAYDDALAIRHDPTVEGRIGLIMVDAGEPALAARYLLRAMVQGGGPAPLMDQFHKAFARVRPKVCYVEVFVSELGADVTVDGDQEVDSSGGRFYVFVLPGTHVFRAKREGFEDAAETIDANPEKTPPVTLTLKPLASKPAKKALPVASTSGSPFLGAGVAFVFGAAPGAAIGPQIFGGWRRGWFSVGLEGRAAWALDELLPGVRLVSWAVGFAPCAHWRASSSVSLFGCAAVQTDWLGDASSGTFMEGFAPRLGLGLRGGIEFVPHERVRLLLWGDAVARASGQRVTAEGAPRWVSSAVLGTFGAGALVTF